MDPKVFERPDAIEILGVGKNMVRSIKFWCAAFKLIEPEEDPRKTTGPWKPTDFAKKMFDNDGLDP